MFISFSGGFLSGGFLARGVFVQGVFVRGFMSGGVCPGGFCPDTQNRSTQYLDNNKCYKPEPLGGVRGILQGFKKYQVDMTAFAW